jgi:hypothetical protein
MTLETEAPLEAEVTASGLPMGHLVGGFLASCGSLVRCPFHLSTFSFFLKVRTLSRVRLLGFWTTGWGCAPVKMEEVGDPPSLSVLVACSVTAKMLL